MQDIITKERLLEILEADYKLFKEMDMTGIGDDYNYSKLMHVSSHFDIFTDDDSTDELFSYNLMLVVKAIHTKTTDTLVGYGAKPDDYILYLTMCNFAFLKDRLEYGTSIRYPWWDNDDKKYDLNDMTLLCNGGYDSETDGCVTGRDAWLVFIDALIEFTEEEMSAKNLLFHKSEEELEAEKKLRIWTKKMESFK